MEIFLQKIREHTECPICSTTFVVPTMLPCSHTFCRRCLGSYNNGKQSGEVVTCPMCRASSEFSGGTGMRNLLAERLIAIEKTLSENHLDQTGMQNVVTQFCHWLDSAPKKLEEERSGLNNVLWDMENAINRRNTELKRLVDEQTSNLISDLNRIREGKMAEFDIAVTQLGKSSSLISDIKQSKSESSKGKKKSNGKKKSEKTITENGPLAEVLSRPFNSSEVKLKLPGVNGDLLSQAHNFVGEIAVKDDATDQAPLHGTYMSNPVLVGSVKITQGPVVVGITILDDNIFIIRSLTPVLQVYDIETFDLKYLLPVAGLSNPQDISSCKSQRCFYIIDTYDNSVYRVELSETSGEKLSTKAALKWSLGDDEPCGISVSYVGEDRSPVILVTCLYSQKICEFDSRGMPLRCVYLQPDLAHPHHALRWGTSGQTSRLILCHGYWSTDPLHRICLVNSNNGRVVGCFGDAPGDGVEALNQPSYMIVDNGGGGLLIADSGNGRIRLIDAGSLEPICDVLTSDSEPGMAIRSPHRLCLDEKRGRLYVVENILNGRVLVFKVIETEEAGLEK